MTARFPQSGTSVAYRIAPAYAGKILALYWAASANSVHRLRAGDTATTILNRATSGATFDATNGRITGTSTVPFTDSVAGGIGGLRENGNFTLGAVYYGDLFNSVAETYAISSVPGPDGGVAGSKLEFYSNFPYFNVQGGAFITTAGFSNDVDKPIIFAMRNLQSDGTAKQRGWVNGTENTSFRANSTPTSTALIGDTSRPLYFGNTVAASGNSYAVFEAVFFGTGTLTDAEMAAITADPSVLVEAYSAPVDTTAPVLSSPTGAAISPTTASASVSTDEGAGTVWCLTDTNATATATAIKSSGTSQAVTTTGVQTFPARTGLTAATTYYNHFVQDDAAGTPNTSTVVNSASFTTPATDTVAPFFSSALVANSAPAVISITMSETLAAFTPAATAFTAVGSVSGAKVASSVARSGANISATFPTPFVYGETITVTYTKPGANMLQDAAGNQTATFGPSAVTNNVAAGAATFAASGVMKNLNGSIVPDGAYSVLVRSATTFSVAPLAVKSSLAVVGGVVPGFSISGPAPGTEYIYEAVNEADPKIRGLARATPA